MRQSTPIHVRAAGSGHQPAQKHTTISFQYTHIGQQDQAVRLSISLGNLPLGLAVGKP